MEHVPDTGVLGVHFTPHSSQGYNLGRFKSTWLQTQIGAISPYMHQEYSAIITLI